MNIFVLFWIQNRHFWLKMFLITHNIRPYGKNWHISYYFFYGKWFFPLNSLRIMKLQRKIIFTKIARWGETPKSSSSRSFHSFAESRKSRNRKWLRRRTRSRRPGTDLKKIYFLANAFISPFNKQTMHVKSLYTKQHVFLKILYPGGIQTQVFSFLRLMQCPLRHAAMALVLFVCLFV
jgi:hypothetical protein